MQYDWCPYLKKGGEYLDRHAQAGRTPCEHKTEIEAMCSQAKECQRWPADHQKQEEQPGIDSPLGPPEGTHLANTVTLDVQPPELRDNSVCCLSP